MTGIERLREYAENLKGTNRYDAVGMNIEAIADQIERETLPRPGQEGGLAMNAEITLRAELRPAILTHYYDDYDKSTEMKVLVHTTMTGAHDGYMCELEDGRIVEVLIGLGQTGLRFTDPMHGQYCFGDEEAGR